MTPRPQFDGCVWFAGIASPQHLNRAWTSNFLEITHSNAWTLFLFSSFRRWIRSADTAPCCIRDLPFHWTVLLLWEPHTLGTRLLGQGAPPSSCFRGVTNLPPPPPKMATLLVLKQLYTLLTNSFPHFSKSQRYLASFPLLKSSWTYTDLSLAYVLVILLNIIVAL